MPAWLRHACRPMGGRAASWAGLGLGVGGQSPPGSAGLSMPCCMVGLGLGCVRMHQKLRLPEGCSASAPAPAGRDPVLG